MKQTVTRLFDSYEQAAAAVRDLEQAGISHSDISLVANDRGRTSEERSFAANDGKGERVAGDAGEGAAIGGVLGGGAGLLAGLGIVAIPGIGPVVAAGWLAATAAGALAGAAAGGATGGLIGALTESGVSDRDAHVYAEGVRRGGAVVSVKTSESNAARVEQVMERHKSVDSATRESAWRETGWTGFNHDAEPWTQDEIVRERGLHGR